MGSLIQSLPKFDCLKDNLSSNFIFISIEKVAFYFVSNFLSHDNHKISVFIFRNDDLKFLKLHQPNLPLVFNVCENPVFVKQHKLHNCAFFDKEKLLTFGPSVLQCVSKQLALIV